jgi:hypothetical protein
MNTETAISTYLFGFVVVVLIALVFRRMLRGWRRRAQRQADVIGEFPPVPEVLQPAILAPTRGLYLGCTVAPDWLDRVNVGDIGYRSDATLTRHPEGILLQRAGAGPIWMPAPSITGVRTERGLAGKVLPGDNSGGVLVIRWRLPSGTEIDTGFRAEDRRVHRSWTAASPRQTGESV